MRLIVDLLGNRHKDLFLKFDIFPTNELKIIDSYYWSDFLNINLENLEEYSDEESSQIIATEIINYWKSIFDNLEKNEIKYFPIDLSDEYVSVFQIKKHKFGIQFEEFITQKYSGWNFNKSNLIENFDIESLQSTETKFSISEQNIIDGLNWSLKNLKNVV